MNIEFLNNEFFILSVLLSILIVPLLVRLTGICIIAIIRIVKSIYMNRFASPEVLVNQIKPSFGMRILEIGSGGGRLTIPIVKHIRTYRGRIDAVEGQRPMLKNLYKQVKARRLRNVSCIHSDPDRLKVKKSNYNYAILSMTLGKCSNRDRVLSNICKSLNVDGRLLISQVFPLPGYIPKKKLIRLCRKNGFKFQSMHSNGFSYTAVFTKKRPD